MSVRRRRTQRNVAGCEQQSVAAQCDGWDRQGPHPQLDELRISEHRNHLRLICPGRGPSSRGPQDPQLTPVPHGVFKRQYNFRIGSPMNRAVSSV